MGVPYMRAPVDWSTKESKDLLRRFSHAAIPNEIALREKVSTDISFNQLGW